MKTVLRVAHCAAAVAEIVRARVRCLLRGVHREEQRQPLGGFRCLACGAAGADMEEMGHPGGGYVSPVRTVFSRERGELTRTSAWEPTRSGRGW